MAKLLKAREDEKKYKEQILKEEQDKINKAIEEHEKKRNNMMGEYDLENKLKILEDQKKYEKNIEEKKKNMTLKELTKKMTKFQNILIADDSSSDDSQEHAEQEPMDEHHIVENIKITINEDIVPDTETVEETDTNETIINEKIDNMITDISNNSN